jgi:hypothetical protein
MSSHVESSIQLRTIDLTAGERTATPAAKGQVPVTPSKAAQNRRYIIVGMVAFALLSSAGGGTGIGLAYHSAPLGVGVSGGLFTAVGVVEALAFWMFA